MELGRENPWKEMVAQTIRRVDSKTVHDLFWICDDEGRFGMMVQFKHTLLPEAFVDQMKGISVVVHRLATTKFYLILHEAKDWEIFLALCWDLVHRISLAEQEDEIVRILGVRIKRWQRFLSQEQQLSMSEKLQMGLFSELCCLLELIPQIGIRNAILGWVGPDADQKDFSLKACFIEVKSFISSKGPFIRISSIGQLEDDIKPVYLQCYGITKVSSGDQIPDLVKAIHQHISLLDIQLLTIFEQRLSNYGFVEGITQAPFFSYAIDSKKVYAVGEGFPRIHASGIDDRIINVNYTIELSKCEVYEQLLQL